MNAESLGDFRVIAMLRWLWDLYFGKQAKEFRCLFDLQESMERLKRATGRSFLSSFSGQFAIAHVSESRVVVHRVVPFIGNSFRPIFFGQFAVVDDRLVLRGEFRQSRWTMAFNASFLVFVSYWMLLALESVLFGALNNLMFPLFGTLFFGLNVGLVWVGKWFARGEVEWISEVVQAALSGY
jgi:amino acid transporter